ENVKPYPPHQIISELFARYFELLSLSRNVNVNGAFTAAEIMDFFANTTKWIREIFNVHIRKKISSDITAYTSKLISQNAFKAEKRFTEKVDSFKKRDSKSWAGNVNSNSRWQTSWNQYEKQKEMEKIQGTRGLKGIGSNN